MNCLSNNTDIHNTILPLIAMTFALTILFAPLIHNILIYLIFIIGEICSEIKRYYSR